MDKEQRLADLKLALGAVWAAESLVTDRAISARLAGATWDEIGDALGMSRQGAHKRFAGKLPYQTSLPADT